jgi:hypothetical protein
MERDFGGLSMSSFSGKELSRQFRVLGQTLAMHTMLRDRYATRALIIDIVLLACSVIFCATIFAGDDVITQAGLSPRNVRYVLGVASITAFFASLIALRVDWKGKSARHRDAAQKLTSILSLFRETRQEDGTWPQDRGAELHQAYWEAMKNVVEVPARPFVGLKARYLKNIELSKMLDSIPGCPVFILRLILFCRSISKAWRKTMKNGKEPTNG